LPKRVWVFIAIGYNVSDYAVWELGFRPPGRRCWEWS